MFLPDVNVLLAMAFEAHAHHEPPKKWFTGAEGLERPLPRGVRDLSSVILSG